MSLIKHVTLQKIVAHDFRYDPRIYKRVVSDEKYYILFVNISTTECPLSNLYIIFIAFIFLVYDLQHRNSFAPYRSTYTSVLIGINLSMMLGFTF